MTYPAKGKVGATAAWLDEAKAALGRAGHRGRGGQHRRHARPLPRARGQRAPPSTGPAPTSTATARWRTTAEELDDCALRVLATVVSRPTDGRAILDAGSKTLSSDTLGLEGFGHVVEYPQLVIEKLSEEHGHVDCGASNARPRIGERVTVIPNHACVVSNLHDVVYGVRGDRVERVFGVEARGRVQ